MSDVRLGRLRSVDGDAPKSVDELMIRVSRGDENAFAELYDELAGMVYGIVLRVVRDPAMSEEITQEVFVDVWKLASRFDSDRGSVRGWTSSMAHGKAVDRVRSEQARRDREDRDHRRSSERPVDNVAESIDQSGTQAAVGDALNTLTSTQREAVTLAYFGGKTYREIAVLLDVPEGTVKTRIRDGLIKLRDTVGSPE